MNNKWKVFFCSLQHIPAMHFFMTRKSTQDYIAVFAFFKSKCPDIKVVGIMSDFEDAISLGAVANYGDIRVRKCYFHYKQVRYNQFLRCTFQEIFFQNIIKIWNFDTMYAWLNLHNSVFRVIVYIVHLERKRSFPRVTLWNWVRGKAEVFNLIRGIETVLS